MQENKLTRYILGHLVKNIDVNNNTAFAENDEGSFEKSMEKSCHTAYFDISKFQKGRPSPPPPKVLC